MDTSVRKFSGSDARLLEQAQIIHQHFSNYLSEFSQFSARFDQAYADRFLQLINAAYDAENNTSLVRQQVTKTISVYETMQKARQIYRKARAYAQLTFYNEDGEYKEITRGYLAARNKQATMIAFLDKLEHALKRHQQQLQDPNKGGMPAGFITQVADTRQLLTDKNQEQEEFIGTKETVTQDRVELLNNIYDTMRQINNTARVIFYDDSAKRKMFSLKKREHQIADDEQE